MTIDDTRHSNLLKLLEQYGSLQELAEKIGHSSTSTLSQVKNRSRDSKSGKPKGIGNALARRIEVKLGLENGWMDKDHSSSKADENVSDGPSSKGMLPLISWVQAGAFCEVIDYFHPGDAEAWLPCPLTHGPNAYILRVEGESMMPEYHDGDLIFVDQRGAYDHGDDIIVRSPDGKATFKRLQKTNEGTYLLALNPSWPDRIIRIPEESQICGKVIFSGRQR